MKKLLILAPPIPPDHLGGDGKFAYDIAYALSGLGINVALVALLYNKAETPSNPNKHLQIIKIPIEDEESNTGWEVPIWDPSFTKERDRVIIDYLDRYELLNGDYWVHEIGGSLYNSVLAELSKKRGIKYSCHMQFVLENYFNLVEPNDPFRSFTTKSQLALVKHAEKCFFLCQFDYAPFRLVSKQYEIIPNGTHIKPISSSENKYDEFSIFYGGRLHSAMKGAMEILPVLSRVLEACTEVRLHICAPDRTHLDLLSDEIQDRVIYHGWKTATETRSILSRCHISLMPSVYEPFGLLAIESLASDTPVLACRTGGLAEIIVPGENGDFISLANPEQIELKLNDLIKDKDHYASFAKNPRYGLERYDIDRIAKRYVAALKHLL